MHGFHFTTYLSYTAQTTGKIVYSVEMVLFRDQEEKPAVWFRGRVDGSYIYVTENMTIAEAQQYMDLFLSEVTDMRELDAEECELLYSLIGDEVRPPSYDV